HAELILFRLSAWMGLHRGKAGDDRFFSRATGRVRLARMPAVRFDHYGEQFAAMLPGTHSRKKHDAGSCPQDNSFERPIAPGKRCRPLPPWSPAFPGAFFCAVGLVKLRSARQPTKTASSPTHSPRWLSEVRLPPACCAISAAAAARSASE